MPSAKPVTCVPVEIGGDRGAVVFAPGPLPALSSLRHRHLIQSQAALFLGDTWHFWVWALHANVSRGDMSLLPKALRGSQTPEWGAQPLPSSGTQPFVVPGAPGISAKP